MKLTKNKRKFKKKHGEYRAEVVVLEELLSKNNKVLTRFEILMEKQVNGRPTVVIEYIDESTPSR